MKNFIFLIFLFLCAQGVLAQNNDLDALKKDFPLLTARFANEIESQRADYIFVVDVSGTMNSFSPVVVPALQDFFRSLQKDDFVSVIKFGGEAANDIGSQGKITDESTLSLINYSAQLYAKPVTESDRRRFYINTDLANMLNYLADDMRQIGRNKLKFVFIFTDFEHDPSADRKGNENWASIKTRFENEQKENDIYMFAMLLKGKDSGKDLAGRDLDKVEAVIPQNFNFSIVTIPNQQALSEWFTNRKNKILLDKFSNIIRNKHTPLNVTVQPETDRDGGVVADVAWDKNELFNALVFHTVSLADNRLLMDSKLPVRVEKSKDKVNIGQIKGEKWCTFFTSVDTKIRFGYRGSSEFAGELTKLGIVEPDETVEFDCNRWMYLFMAPLWLSIAILFVLVLYLFLVIKAIARNNAPGTKINGTFIVEKEGVGLAEQAVKNSNCVDIGKNGATIRVDDMDCNWRIKIVVKRFTPFLLKKPVIHAILTTGVSMKILNRRYKPHEKVKHTKNRMITIEDGEYTIFWR